MNIILPIHKFDIHSVFFSEKKKNIIIDGEFSKILYSTPAFVMNGIYLDCHGIPVPSFSVRTPSPVRSIKRFSPSYNSFSALSEARFADPSVPAPFLFDSDSEKNEDMVTSLCKIEEQIMHCYKRIKGIDKYAVCNLKNQLLNGTIRMNGVDSGRVTLILKISGIWETANNIGITFKLHSVEKPQHEARMWMPAL